MLELDYPLLLILETIWILMALVSNDKGTSPKSCGGYQEWDQMVIDDKWPFVSVTSCSPLTPSNPQLVSSKPHGFSTNTSAMIYIVIILGNAMVSWHDESFLECQGRNKSCISPQLGSGWVVEDYGGCRPLTPQHAGVLIAQNGRI